MMRFSLFAAFILLSGSANPASADIILGPDLTNDVSGQTNSGLEITALTNSVLQSVVYHNQGGADTIELAAVAPSPVNGAIGVTSVLGTISVPAGNPTFTASNLNWQMTAGTTYVLVATGNEDNGMYAPYSFAGNPTSDGQIAIDQGVFSADLVSIAFNPNDWGDFNNITTASVPEPGSFILLALTGMVVFCGWLRLAVNKQADSGI